MLRVLIADDEIKIIQLIEYLIDWKKLKMQVVARAEKLLLVGIGILSMHKQQFALGSVIIY